jgi:hypothetical protein
MKELSAVESYMGGKVCVWEGWGETKVGRRAKWVWGRHLQGVGTSDWMLVCGKPIGPSRSILLFLLGAPYTGIRPDVPTPCKHNQNGLISQLNAG